MSAGGERPERHALESLIEQTLRRAGLRGAQRARVSRELRAHVEDALDGGIPLADVAADFGDPDVVGALIRQHPPVLRSRAADATIRVASTAATVLAIAAGIAYASTASRLGTFSQQRAGSDWLDTLASVARTKQHLLARLQHSRVDPASALAAIEDGVATASHLARQRDVFGHAVAASVSLGILETSSALAASDSLSDSERRRLSADLRELAEGQVMLDSSRERQWIDDVALRSFDSARRPIAHGLRAVQAMKGVRRPTLRARLLEPVLFADAEASRRRWIAMVTGHFDEARRAQVRFRDEIGPTLAQLDAPGSKLPR